MRRIVKIGLLLLIAIVIVGTILKINQTLSAKEVQANMLRYQPNLSTVHFILSTNQVHTMIDSKPTLIMLFDPDCEHCQYEAEQLQKHHREFAQANVYLLTNQSITRAHTFAQRYGLDTLAMMHIGTVTREESYRLFGPTSVPHLFIYGPDKQLRKEFKGETKIESLLKHL